VSGAGCQVVTGDALRLDWHELASGHLTPDTRHRFKIVGNIPYNITSPLLDKALTPPLPARIVFLVQAEVADRIAAPPGSKTYGALSVGVQAVCRVERLFTVRAGAFTPPPKVTSAVVRLTPLAQPLVAPEAIAPLRAFVTACFTRRRKQLRNVVMAATGRSAAVVAVGLAALGLDPRVRPETLAPEVFVRLLRWSARL
jgi:16S rRNA (adenine1518-N6/adenine1519-N6)-dimethyltransferase